MKGTREDEIKMSSSKMLVRSLIIIKPSLFYYLFQRYSFFFYAMQELISNVSFAIFLFDLLPAMSCIAEMFNKVHVEEKLRKILPNT